LGKFPGFQVQWNSAIDDAADFVFEERLELVLVAIVRKVLDYRAV
jgi:hypothetical protein